MENPQLISIFEKRIRKPKPAPIFDRDKYRLHFSHKGKQYRRYCIDNENQANAMQAEVNNRLNCLKARTLKRPSHISLEDFIFDNLENISIDPTLIISPTLFQLIEEYIELYNPKEKEISSHRTELIHLRHLKRFCRDKGYGDIELDRINVKFFDLYKQWRFKQNVQNNTIRKELITFRLLFKMAKKYEYIPVNVLKEVTKPQKDEKISFRSIDQLLEAELYYKHDDKKLKQIKRFVYLSWQDIDELIEVVQNYYTPNHWIIPMLITYAETGARKGELLKLNWTAINFEKNYLLLHSNKTKNIRAQERYVPMTQKLKETLLKQRKKVKKEIWVFPGPNGGQLSKSTLRNAL